MRMAQGPHIANRRVSTTLGLLLTLASAAPAAFIDHEIVLTEQDLTIAKSGEYDVLALPGCDVTREVGMPQLPVLPITLAIPRGARATRLEVVAAESRDLLDRLNPLPAQPPRILPNPAVEQGPWTFVGPDPSLGDRARPYPGKVAQMTSTGRLPGNELIGVSVFPVHYLPDTGRMRVFTRIELRLHYEAAAPELPTARPRESLRSAARSLVANDAQVRGRPIEPITAESRLSAGDFEYVVITTDDLAAAFQPLVDWKTRKGVPATTVTVDWIEASYTGADTQEKIRAFIQDASDTWRTVFVLLGGDTHAVPARRAYAMTCEANGHPDEDAIGCDLYYADLDGTWDDDGDGTYGEVDDGVDLYPDVFVGRASVTGQTQAAMFAERIVLYESAPTSDYLLDMLMAGEILWTNPYTDGGVALNHIDREFIPPRFDPITKLYASLGNESAASVHAALSAGKSHFMHNGHAWYSILSCGSGYLSFSDIDNLTNGTRRPIVYSVGCWPAAFDLDETSCIAEHFITAHAGGAVAFIGNSRYGWGAPGNPVFGHSDRFMQEFYRVVFGEGPTNAGVALAVAKAAFVPFSQTENVYRWHQYQLNLLGDPEMPIWTDEPAELTVSHPDSIVAGSSEFDALVWNATGPVEGALVCLTNSADVYERGVTGEDGTTRLALETAGAGSLYLTVTAPDHHPYETRLSVEATGTYVRVDQAIVDDSEDGNGDGMPGPGEVIDVELVLRNSGTSGAGSVSATLSCSDQHVALLESEATYGGIPAGATASGSAPFKLEISPDCPDRHVALLDVAIAAGGARVEWPGAVALTVAAPVLVANSYDVDDAGGGDGDGIPEPGEALRVMVEIANVGLARASAPEVGLASGSPLVIVSDDTWTLNDMAPGRTSRAVFGLEIDAACPEPCFPELDVEATTLDGATFEDAIVIAIGNTGLADDFESGGGGWTHGGFNDLWTLGDIRTHSGQASWYCGSPVALEYTNEMDAHLDSPPFVLGVGAQLSFWCWYEVPIYHEDGLYVELLSAGSVVDTLDFIGSGGALEDRGSIGNDWLEYRYQIDRAPGDTVQVRFRFVSDAADVEEGVYIDDVSVSAGQAPSGAGVPGSPMASEAPIRLYQNTPNPFGLSTSIRFTLMEEGTVTLSVYNIQGRLIRTLVDEFRPAGDYEASWDGRDELGSDVAGGVYMCRLSFGEHEATGKMILVR